MTSVIYTAPDQCRRCYSCVRRCPAKAIRVHDGQAEVIEDRCVACGRCVAACPSRAKRIVDNLPRAMELIAEGAVVMVAPSFPAAFPQWQPGQVLAALRSVGFAGVYEVAFGAELLSRAYRRRFDEQPRRLTIATACPAAVGYIQKHAPTVVPFLAPLLSPMAVMGKVIKERLRPGVPVVFAGPCTAKIKEREDPSVAPWVDAVITFPELKALLAERRIDPATLASDEFNPPHSRTGGVFPVPGGLVHTAGLPSDLLESLVFTTIGLEGFIDTVEALTRRLARGALPELQARFFDVLYCQGCTGGPLVENSETLLRRKERVLDFIRRRPGLPSDATWSRSLDELGDLELGRGFRSEGRVEPTPSEEEVRQILSRTGKLRPEDELNCRACGYRSCREKAIAVFRGLAEIDMCLPYLVSRLEAMVDKLNRSHEELTTVHDQLLRAERMASMGQLAAGIAHEVNNPLGTVLIYAHLLLEDVEGSEQLRADAEMIVREANRCKSIVGGLLDFARQNKVDRRPVDVAELLTAAVALGAAQARDSNPGVAFVLDVAPGLPTAALDRDQLLQVLLNLLRNAIDVMPGGGTVTIGARHLADAGELSLTVADTGPGIPAEHMNKLFSPFFTTKPVGRGTGLGLPICYGIVKMHRGTITASNRTDGPGARFEVRVPVDAPAAEAGVATLLS
jgi:two-component system, NtrC family, sensor kinase